MDGRQIVSEVQADYNVVVHPDADRGEWLPERVDDLALALAAIALWGSLAPDGAITKVAGLKHTRHRGPARVFDGEAACFAAVEAPDGKSGVTSSLFVSAGWSIASTTRNVRSFSLEKSPLTNS